MNTKHSLKDILHNADLCTIESISENNTLYDARTKQRVYEKYLQKTVEKKEGNSAYSEIFTVERHKNRFLMKMVGLTAVCAIATGGIILGFRNMKSSKPNNDSEPPIFFKETTAASSVTSGGDNNITIKTTTTKSSENTYMKAKETTLKKYTTTAGKNDKGENTSQSNDSTARITTKQNSGKTITQPTTTSSKVEVPSDKKMTIQQLMEFINCYGDAMTWEDFEPYVHEDTNPSINAIYKIHGWNIPIYENGTHKYTLTVLGFSTSGKPSSVNFYKSTQTSGQPFIDIRNEDITEFLSEDYDLANALSFVDTTDYIKTIEVSGPDSMHNAFLGQSEIKEILTLIKDIKLIKKEGDSWQTSSTIYYNITLNNNNRIHNIQVQYQNLIIDGTGYRAEKTSLNALFDYAASIVESHRPSEQINVNGVWCWHDDFIELVDFRDITDCITIKQFPDLVFDWHGKTYSVAAYDSDGNDYGGADVRFNAYFADLNGDGYPELCSTNMCESNSMLIAEADIWDILSNKHYSLASSDEYSYYFYEENGELFVNKKVATAGLNADSGQGEKGKIRFNGDSVMFVSVN